MGRRYHPQIIRFALSLHGKSPSAYRELRDSGALILPSERVLRDYKNYFKPKAGINSEDVEDLRGKTANFNDIQRYVVVIMDEIKIQSNLVFDKYSGDWKCHIIPVNAHFLESGFYFGDIGEAMDFPHLLKTAWNCLYNSGSGSCSRYMWNDGKYLLFRHIANLYYSEQQFALHTLPKPGLDHIVFTLYSKMKVKLATQVLSTSVAIALEECGYAYVLATAKFCKMMNDFFDCTNVMSMTEYVSKRNQFVKPYTCQDDERFSWLKDVFLGYWIVGKIRQWQEMVNTPLTTERKCFFPPRPTRVSRSLSTPILRQFSSCLLRDFNTF
ncbi:Transposable element P transposase [Paramuricea clavata]|uniref:Transposable element P transposase n=1 Tax=Paramuricea clavata TaxID=317549 RepID=A0A7D9J7F8_PARCT|nr:Transposable element P transposase [Paramuricea clavata]